jgi:hypothetical protein
MKIGLLEKSKKEDNAAVAQLIRAVFMDEYSK